MLIVTKMQNFFSHDHWLYIKSNNHHLVVDCSIGPELPVNNIR